MLSSDLSQQSTATPGKMLSFFIFCSAADKDLLLRCPKAEQIKYASIGATVFFTGVLATLSGGYALYTVFNSVILSVLLGLFWGALVFNLDRFIVSTIKKSGSKISQYRQVLPRLFLAIFLSIVISKPLELKIFEQEINEYLHYTGMEKITALDQAYQKKQDAMRAEIAAIKSRLDERFALREKYYEDYKCECEGSCGTGARGVGSECLRKESKYKKADQEYQDLQAQSTKQMAAIQKEMEGLSSEKKTYQGELKDSFASGLMARLNALNQLPAGPSIAIVLLLICIEVAPIFAKLLSPLGPYDHLLKTVEYEYEMEEISSINIRNQKLNNQLTLISSLEQQKVEQQVVHNKEMLAIIEQAHQELLKEQLSIWVEKEKSKLRKKVDQE
ncbi:MAG: DUF4407 domain-containing protein [Cytophagaceae bacterium]|jgi:hypothetical protein|nr:DUF4407 domain-containing protein [Cytophagaceae bacterium]